MRCKALSVLAVASFLVFFVAVCFGTQNDSAPAVFFPQTLHEFAPVLEGAKVVHEFVIQNKGTATLNVERVKTS